MPRSPRLVLAALAVLALTSCAPAGDGTAVDRPGSSTAVATSDTGASSAGATPDTTGDTLDGSPTTPSTEPEEAPTPDPDRRMAPDVSLELADGSTFVLSEEARPVFLVFWAEW